MKRSCKKMMLAGIIVFCMNAAHAQDIHFSQFYEMPLYRNPAFAGIVNGDIRVQAVFRSQWNSVANAYKTGALNAEFKMPVGKRLDYVTCGFQAFYDKAGSADLTTTILMPVVNYHKALGTTRNMYLSAAFAGGFVSRNLDRSKITTNNQFDGGNDGENLTNTQYSYWDGSAGISLNTGIGEDPHNNLLVGVALHHFNKPKNAFYENSTLTLNPKLVFSGDVKFGVTSSSWLVFHSDYTVQGGYRELVGGVLYGLKIGPQLEDPDYTLQAGTFLRWNDAIIPVIKLDYHPFSIAFSYDVNISKLKPASQGHGGAELSLSYIGFLDRDNSSMKAFRCPRF